MKRLLPRTAALVAVIVTAGLASAGPPQDSWSYGTKYHSSCGSSYGTRYGSFHESCYGTKYGSSYWSCHESRCWPYTNCWPTPRPCTYPPSGCGR
jgi:hypothetical protein